MKSFNTITGLSDHNLILIARKLRAFHQLRIPKFELGDLKNVLNGINWEEHLSHNCAEEDVNVFMNVIQNTVNSFMRKVKNKYGQRNSLPWISGDLWCLMKQRDHALKQFFKSRLEYDRRIYLPV